MTYGYVPTIGRRVVRGIAKTFVAMFRLHGRSIWSNEVLQAITPSASTAVDGQSFQFRTGNGRLLWRVRTFPQEEPLMMKWISSMTDGDVVLDIGANAGLYATAMARKSRLVYACELDPLNVGLIKENAFLNGVHDRVVILPVACGSRDGVVNVYFRDLTAGDALQSMNHPQTLPTRLGRHAHNSPLLTLSLDELWERACLERPTKVKIDVDGNEKPVFEGSRQLCATANEIYFEDSDTPECRDVLQKLIAMGFVEVEKAGFESGSAPGNNNRGGANRLLRKANSSER